MENIAIKKYPGLDGFVCEFYKIFKKLTPMLLKIYQKPEKEGILIDSFYKVRIILIQI